jgi:plasmid stabilization system protein ParE
VPRVVVTPRAVEDLHELMVGLGLPADAPDRVRRSLRMLERFPLAGRALSGRWEGTRFLIGPWPWMVLVHVHDEPADAVFVVAIHDGRSASSATARLR